MNSTGSMMDSRSSGGWTFESDKRRKSAVVTQWRLRFGRYAGRLGWLLLAVLVAGLGPLAAVSPVDPSWLSAFNDGADLDELILACFGALDARRAAVPQLVLPTPRAEHALSFVNTPVERLRSRRAQDRAPPLG